MKVKALWHSSSYSSEILEQIISPKHQVKIKSLYSMISLGTERIVSKGEVPVNMYSSMTVQHMEGSFEFPIKYGYSLVGEIEGTSKNVLVHLMHPHQSYCDVKEEDYFEVKEKIPPQRACLASNLETCLNAIWDARLDGNEKRIAVLGFGSVGALLAETLRLYVGIDPLVIEPNPWKIQKAKSLGFEVVAAFCEKNFEVVFNTTANETALNSGLAALALEGTLIELSWYGNRPVQINLGESFHTLRLKIISSQVGQIPKHMQPMTYLKRKEIVFKLLENEIYDEYISRIINLEEAPKLFEEIRKGPLKEDLIILIKYP